MKVSDNRQMHEADRIAMEQFGIPGILLMENAGLAVVSEIQKDFIPGSRIGIICGTGNNGGDGMVIARHLSRMGYLITLWLAGDPERIDGDARINWRIVRNLGVPVRVMGSEADLPVAAELERCHLLVDCLLGTGLSGPVSGWRAELIEAMNRCRTPVLAVDIPSGVNGDNGAVDGVAVRAYKTVALAAPQYGNLLYPGAALGGELKVCDIGIPEEALEAAGITDCVITRELAGAWLPRRLPDSHKGSFGKARLFAGSPGMAGAAVLACRAVLRSGAGLARLHLPEAINGPLKVAVPELITEPYLEPVDSGWAAEQVRTASDSQVFAAGPGCGVTETLKALVSELLAQATYPVVLDADALNALALDPDSLERPHGPLVLTPHIGEMSRLTGLDMNAVGSDPVGLARRFAKQWNAVVVLKSARTVVASPAGCVWIHIGGNSGMATAGSGDVLTGIITGFIAQGLPLERAAAAAVYVHGASGDRAAGQLGEHGLIAGDLVETLPYVLKELSSLNRTVMEIPRG